MNDEPHRLPHVEQMSTESLANTGDPGITWEQIRQHLDAAVAQFIEHDAYLIENDVNERSMTHKFATYLQNRLPEFHVDCEYNRDGNLPKRLVVRERTSVPDDDTDGTTIYPDIIVHERGTNNNILVIEAKKAGRPTGLDQEKILAFMTDDAFRYRFGTQLIFQSHPARIDIHQIRVSEHAMRMTYEEHPWVLDDDLSWMWYDADPQSAQETDGDFRVYLLHEFGHWVVAQEQESSVGVVGLGLYGLTYHDAGHVRVAGGGGGVRLNYGKFVGPKEMLAVDVAGMVAERLNEDADFLFTDPIALFKASETFDCDYHEGVRHLRLRGITDERSPAFANALSAAMDTASGIIRGLLPRLRAQVLRLEQIAIEQRLPKLEIAWSGKHASLLTGKPDHHYEIP